MTAMRCGTRFSGRETSTCNELTYFSVYRIGILWTGERDPLLIRPIKARRCPGFEVAIALACCRQSPFEPLFQWLSARAEAMCLQSIEPPWEEIVCHALGN